jgi:N-acetylmuramoyl-L-alanine amidase
MKKCALVIGHKKSSPGALNKASGLTEFAFNEALAFEMESEVTGVEVQKVYRRTYNSLPGDINELKPDFIISLHCNAFNESATGTEVLYYHRSTKGKLIAKILNDHLVNSLGLKDRGIKPKTSEDRGDAGCNR